jgi:hypothetical protein
MTLGDNQPLRTRRQPSSSLYRRVVWYKCTNNHNAAASARSDRLLSATLPAQTFLMRKRPLHVSLSKQRHNAETILKICELFIHGDIHYNLV